MGNPNAIATRCTTPTRLDGYGTSYAHGQQPPDDHLGKLKNVTHTTAASE